ncbi:MAG: TetR/AcrR family transcriptional regulator [Erysipelothrix sp.]|nr:TetR/AcrR family transcriptional regulator [Erysipelothrix sp.]
MPKETFINLPIEKQKLIFDACIKEFSTYPFSQASINQIIKNANISRGSFYQYFEDKWDAYEMMMGRIAQEKFSLLPPPSLKNHFFDVMEQFFHDTMKWIQLKPDYFQIGILIDYDYDELIVKLREASKSRLLFLEDMIRSDQAQGLIDSNVNPSDLVDMITEISKSALLKAFRSSDFEEMEKIFLTRLHIIKKGVQVHV